MTIRPVDFNGMIQNTHEVSNAKTNEDNKPLLQQQNVQAAVVREEEASMTTVQDMEETQQQEYRYEDGEGNGQGYEGNRGRKKRGKPKEKKDDGQVIVKGAHPTFDMKI
jgi:hypothetical protein